MRSVLAVLVLALAVVAPGCRSLTPSAIAAAPFYRQNPLPERRVVADVAYRADGNAKHRLDFYLPDASPQPTPVVVFVHGGGWNTGDKNLTLGPHDLYANVGRFFARHGVLAAVVNYRLLPSVDWRTQTEDVAEAVAFVRKQASRYGGNPQRLFLMGHSAGAQLAARIALDPSWLDAAGLPDRSVCGVVSVSGAGFDLTHVPSIRDDYAYFATRFAPPGFVPRRSMSSLPDPWQREASPTTFARADAPPFRLMVLRAEAETFRMQADRLNRALRQAGATTSPVEVYDGGPHSLGAVLLSRADLGIARSALRFVQTRPCAG
ncbi:MAG: alpha/beta hydrolase [Bacteroidetes bacterium]|nr:alpha/beta hydrolase [Bacteroidota bacterium]